LISDIRIMIHRRYKALPGRDGVDVGLDEAEPVIGPGLCRMVHMTFREHSRVLKNPSWAPRVSVAMPSDATELIWVGCRLA
jgi:hypothetical protein